MDENRNLLESARNEQSRLAALYRVSQSLGTSLNLQEVLNQVMDLVISLTGAERGFLMLQDADTEALKLQAARNMEQDDLEHKDMEISRSVVKAVLRDKKGMLLTDAQRDPRFAGKESIVLYALRSIMCAPLRASGCEIGVVYVDNRAQSGVFVKADLELLEAFAGQAAIAIENARLYTCTDQALNERVAELETLSRIDHDLSAQLDLPKLVDLICGWVKEGTGATRAWLVRLDEEGRLEIMAGETSSRPETVEPPVEQAVREAARQDQLLSLDIVDDAPARLFAPVHCGRRSICVLVAERAEPFSAASRQFVERLASRAASALQNARLYQAVQQANQEKSKFVSVVTHELRIPMTSIKGYTDLLKQGAVGPINDMQKNFLGVIRNNVDRMSALVSDLSEISHIETGRMQLKSEFVPLAQYLDETVQSIMPRIEEKEQTLTVDVAPDLKPVYADFNRLVQVLTNLISNANKYTKPGGKIRLSARADGEWVRVEVSDSGIGISEQDQKNLFTQFFRSENPDVREQQGWGLGLNLAKRFVNLMGGDMGAQSVLGEGSTFWFTLPTWAVETPAQ